MNGERKFHKANGPAFHSEQIWKACDGSGVIAIIESVRKWTNANGKWDYSVYYRNKWDGTLIEKDAWNFQVRYYHSADENLTVRRRTLLNVD